MNCLGGKICRRNLRMYTFNFVHNGVNVINKRHQAVVCLGTSRRYTARVKFKFTCLLLYRCLLGRRYNYYHSGEAPEPLSTRCPGEANFSWSTHSSRIYKGLLRMPNSIAIILNFLRSAISYDIVKD